MVGAQQMRRMTEERSQTIGEPDHIKFKSFYSEKDRKPLKSFEQKKNMI